MAKLIEITREGRVALIRLNRPEVLNALNGALAAELARFQAQGECSVMGCSALKRAVWGDTINEPDNGLAFEFRGFTVSFAEGKIFVSDKGHAFAQYELSHFLQDSGAVVRGIRRECLQRDSMRELSKI